jgi:uncharacterized surface protein with fasciclin (FAS1) repeats
MTVFSRRAALQASLGSSLAAAFAGRASAQPLGPLDALSVMQDDGRFSTWVGMIFTSGLDRYCTGLYPYTMFAPTNTALSRYPYLIRNLLGTGRASQFMMPNTSRIISIIRSHQINGVHPPTEFEGKNTTLTGVADNQIVVDGTGGGNQLVVKISVGTTLDTSHAETNVLTAPNVVIYPIDSLNLEAFQG